MLAAPPSPATPIGVAATTGLAYPAMFTVAPDGRIFSSERTTGNIRVFNPADGSTSTYAVISTGADVAGASVTVATAGAPAGRFAYADLSAPVTLLANRTYYLVSQETAGGDAWYDYDTNVVTTAVAANTGVIYSFAASPTSWTPGGSGGMAFGPLSFLYR